MDGISIAMINAGIKNNLRSRTLLVIFIGLAVMFVGGIAFIFCLLGISPAVAKGGLDMRSDLELYLGLILYTACMMGLGVDMNAFTAPSMTREKSRRNIESLLATPLKPKDIWLARSLAIFLPGLVVGEVLTIIALFAINYIYIVPEVGFLVTPWIAVSSFVMVPLIYFCLSLLVNLIGLTGSPNTGNVIVQVFLPVMVALVINVGLHHILDTTSWLFTLINLGIAAVIGIVIVFLYPRLTKERIVLSRQE